MKRNMMYALGGTLLVVGTLAAFKIFKSGGSPPAGGERAPAGAAAGQCPHAAPKDLCFICDPALREKGRLWCSEHSRYEDRCWLCHAEMEDKKRLYCKEHSLYEDECLLCHPELKAASRETSQVPPPGALMCREHGVPEAECGSCHPEAVGRLKPGQAMKVRLPSPGSAKLVGIRTTLPTRGATAPGVECYAELAFNQNRLADIPTPVGGTIQEVLADLGTLVADRQPLARIWSAQIGETMAKAVLSRQTLERERALRAKGITSTRELQEAEAAYHSAFQQARTLGLTEDELEKAGRNPDETVYVYVRAPFAGEVIARQAVLGELVQAGKSLFTVVDRSTMWAILSFPEAALVRVRAGQTVELKVDSLPGRIFTGRLTWIAPGVDEKSRLGKARAEFQNPDGLLKARMFGRAQVLLAQAGGAWLVPQAAIHRIDGAAVAFVGLTGDLFEARAVRVGSAQDGQVEVLEGLKSGDAVVVEHGFSVKSQLLVSRLGAGCTD
ncbi:MAG: efflux RND transporter periplasmic adaptor subunit [Elusimicrobiota bacterium]|nr:efflux RND transporter periplasmic adaptor subunit [Elusimicrobiota bacterium]